MKPLAASPSIWQNQPHLCSYRQWKSLLQKGRDRGSSLHWSN